MLENPNYWTYPKAREFANSMFMPLNQRFTFPNRGPISADDLINDMARNAMVEVW